MSYRTLPSLLYMRSDVFPQQYLRDIYCVCTVILQADMNIPHFPVQPLLWWAFLPTNNKRSIVFFLAILLVFFERKRHLSNFQQTYNHQTYKKKRLIVTLSYTFFGTIPLGTWRHIHVQTTSNWRRFNIDLTSCAWWDGIRSMLLRILNFRILPTHFRMWKKKNLNLRSSGHTT